MSDLQDYKSIIRKAIPTYIKSNNWQRLSATMPLADTYKISKSLRRQGWNYLASYYHDNGQYIDAVIAYNKARRAVLDDRYAITGLLTSLTAIYNDLSDKFSREDLVLLDNQIDRLLSFYTVHHPIDSGLIEAGKTLSTRIKTQLQLAPSKVETPATHRIEAIYNALYSDMTIEEIRAEFARIMAPYFREHIGSFRQDQKEIKAGSGGTPPPKKKNKKINKKKKQNKKK
jgi:hypothetical protein